MKDADGMVSGSMPLNGRYIKTKPSDPEDKTGNKARKRILYHGRTGL